MNYKRIYDVTRELTSYVTKLGNRAVRTQIQFISNGDPYNLSKIETVLHVGTHCDAQCHFIDGAADIAEIPLERFFGDCYVLDTTGYFPVTAEFLKENIPVGTTRLVLKNPEGGVLDEEAADYLCATGVGTICTEYGSIGLPGVGNEVHRILLGHGMVIVEGLILDEVPEGRYVLSAAPLKIAGSDGAQCRAFLIEE